MMPSAIRRGSFCRLLVIGVPVGIALGEAWPPAIAQVPFLHFDPRASGLVSWVHSFMPNAVVLFTLVRNNMRQDGISRRPVAVVDYHLGRRAAISAG